MFQQPALNAKMFVGRVIVADQIDLLLCRDGLADRAQEAKPLPMAMPLLTEPVDFAGGACQGRRMKIVRKNGANIAFRSAVP